VVVVWGMVVVGATVVVVVVGSVTVVVVSPWQPSCEPSPVLSNSSSTELTVYE
jgi:hypothetical protein